MYVGVAVDVAVDVRVGVVRMTYGYPTDVGYRTDIERMYGGCTADVRWMSVRMT